MSRVIARCCQKYKCTSEVQLLKPTEVLVPTVHTDKHKNEHLSILNQLLHLPCDLHILYHLTKCSWHIDELYILRRSICPQCMSFCIFPYSLESGPLTLCFWFMYKDRCVGFVGLNVKQQFTLLFVEVYQSLAR